MFAYHLRMALKSIRRNLGLSALMVAAIAQKRIDGAREQLRMFESAAGNEGGGR
jgi:hypothetical protein